MSEREQIGILEEFRLEFRKYWDPLPNKGLFFGLLAAWLVLFHFLGNSTFGYVKTPSLLGWMLNAYKSNDWDEGHGLVIPLVVLALIWWRRKELMALPLRLWPSGLAVVGFALVLHVLAYMVQQPRISIVAFFVGIYGLLGVAWGWRFMRANFFAFCLFVFCIPLGSLAEPVTFPLRLLSAQISVGISQAMGFEVIRAGTQIYGAAAPGGMPTFQFDVAPACSGIRSLVSLLALTLIFGFVSFKSPWRRLAMVLSALPLAVFANVTRITFTIFVADLFGQEAGGKVEQKSGFVTFAIAIVVVMLLEYWMREPAPVKPASTATEVRSV
jgi:exosortase